jgi:hypothetical protein
MARYSIETQAARKGWTVLEGKQSSKHDFMRVTLCKTTDAYHPYVVHKFNETDGGFYFGEYFADEQEARQRFMYRQ